ncbi:gliding motility-associated C-terminal domain-containing protein [uncultured Algibacter sp.]|uniref:gliding motility-associated C-terminal domain-containing protein n=1 Tax=uncultured Algibacter sp. TaxID=298659 RepID=UPI00262B27A3|nr:gliding motility-associated C-terminal domain-containing protein [uncultured Algibacter sp.]
MKTKPLSRHLLRIVSCILLLLWTTNQVFAQCPNIADPSPPPICDASGFTFSDLDAFATTGGNGIVWYNVATGGTAYFDTELVSEGTYYVDDNSGICGTRESITISFQVSPSNQNLDRLYCSNENPTIQTYINDVLQPFIPFGGSVEVYNDSQLTDQANSTDPISVGAFSYYIVFIDNGGCESQIEIGNVGLFNSPLDPTPTDPQLLCSASSPTIANLDPGTASSHSWYVDLDVFGNPVQPALSPSTPLIDGNTYYVQVDDFFCDSNPIPVTVNIDTPVDPGTPASLEYCEDNIPTTDFDLFSLLGGMADTTGTWTGPTTIFNGHQGRTNISSLTAPSTNVYTYTVPSNGACPDGVSTVTITLFEILNSGIPSAANPASYCEADLPSAFDLFSLLDNEDPNGLWTQGTSSADPPVTSSLNLVGFTPGTYNFTYTQNLLPSPCLEESTTVQVTVLQDLNAGNAINQVFCENDIAANSPFDLFNALDGSQDNNSGTWTDSSNNTISNTLDITGFTVTGSPYTFNYTIDNGTCTDTEPITITIEPAPESGTPNAPLEFCASELTAGQTVDLFDLLEGEDQTGTWNDDNGSSALAGNTLTVDGLGDGTYNFTFDVDAVGSCDDVLVTVTVIINDPPPPTASPSQSFCDAGTVGDITVTGTNIQWYDQATGGTPLSGTIDLTDGGMYYATQTDPITGCESSVRTLVSASVNQTPVAGNAGSPITECNNNSSIDLFSTLDGTQDAGGIWQDNDSTGAVSGNNLDATSLTAGTYNFTYFIAATPPCIDASVSVTLTIEESLNPGTPASTNICSDGGTTDLFPLLGGADTGGTWSPALTSTTGVFDPAIDTPGVYTYTLTNSCGDISSNITVSVTQAANAGTDNSVTICVADGPTDLFGFLGGAQTGGTWSPALASGTGVFDPLVDIAGDYAYTIAPTAPCTSGASATITATIGDSPPPTVINSNPSYCLVDNPTVADLDMNLTATGTITWYTDATLTIVLAPTDTLVDDEDYFATQTGGSGCPSSVSVQVDVTINDTPTPTLSDPSLTYCINDGPTINNLTSNIDYDLSLFNVVWYDAIIGGNAISDTSTLSNNTTYYAVLVDSVTGCESSIRLDVTPDLTGCEKVVFPDGFSPNGDPVNETFDVENLDVLYPNFVMEIYNRYGNLVYKGNASTPRFNGKSNQSGTIGSADLPVGVYFYIFNFNDGINKPEQGRLYLSR